MNERRSAKSRAVRLGKPFFMKVPKSAAASILTGIALVTIIASSLQPDIGFGAFFLLICAFGAWFVGNRFAALLGIFIALDVTPSFPPAGIRAGRLFCASARLKQWPA